MQHLYSDVGALLKMNLFILWAVGKLSWQPIYLATLQSITQWQNKSVIKSKEQCKSMTLQTFKSDCNVKETFHAFWTSLKSRTHWSFACFKSCFSSIPSNFRLLISFSFSSNSLRASLAYKKLQLKFSDKLSSHMFILTFIFRHACIMKSQMEILITQRENFSLHWLTAETYTATTDS